MTADRHNAKTVIQRSTADRVQDILGLPGQESHNILRELDGDEVRRGIARQTLAAQDLEFRRSLALVEIARAVDDARADNAATSEEFKDHRDQCNKRMRGEAAPCRHFDKMAVRVLVWIVVTFVAAVALWLMLFFISESIKRTVAAGAAAKVTQRQSE